MRAAARCFPSVEYVISCFAAKSWEKSAVQSAQRSHQPKWKAPTINLTLNELLAAAAAAAAATYYFQLHM
jgi:hypothetical protein